MIKPDLVEYGGNLILREEAGHIFENIGSKILLFSNQAIGNLFKFDKGTSYSAAKVSNTTGKIANKFPDKSSNFIKNLTILSADHPLYPEFSGSDPEKNEKLNRSLGYGLPNYDKAIYSFDNRVVLIDENEIGLNKIATYRIDIPDIYFETSGNKTLGVVLTFNPITRGTRGDSYIANCMDFRLFHSVTPETVANNYSTINLETDKELCQRT